jgi:hypothetical protein
MTRKLARLALKAQVRQAQLVKQAAKVMNVPAEQIDGRHLFMLGFLEEWDAAERHGSGTSP